MDGTLIWSGGAGVRALDQAFREVFGIQRGMEGIICDGKTDPAIVREVLWVRGLDTEQNIQKLLLSYADYLPEAVRASTGYEVLPGVRETLKVLSGRRNTLCGLATGNTERGARAKLERAGLEQYFSVGGYGSDSEDRAEVVRVAIRRARRVIGGAEAQPIVIGDTPRDVAAAHAASALAVGVATGHFDLTALSSAGADLVLPNLTRPKSWLSRLSRLPAGCF